VTSSVLAVLTVSPWPAQSGIARRLDAIVDACHRSTQLTVAVVVPDGRDVAPPSSVRTTRVRRSPSRAASVTEILRGLPDGRPITMGFYRRGGARARLRTILEETQPDVVFTHGLGGAGLCDGLFPARRTVLDADTIDPSTYRRIGRELGGFRGLQWTLDADRIARWMRRELPAYGSVTVVSRHDRELLDAIAPAARLEVVPNGVHLGQARREDPGGGTFLFVGGRTYPPNRNGLSWLVRSVLADIPTGFCELRVVGEGATPIAEGVVAVGVVPEMAAEWRQATALLVPIRSGGGTRLKVIEAMAYGVPVISTAIGVEGLDVQAGQHYLLAERASEWRLAIDRISADPSLRAQLAEAGRSFVERHHDWTVCTQPLVRSLHRVASGGVDTDTL